MRRIRDFFRVLNGLRRGILPHELVKTFGIDPRTSFGYEKDFMRNCWISPARADILEEIILQHPQYL